MGNVHLFKEMLTSREPTLSAISYSPKNSFPFLKSPQKPARRTPLASSSPQATATTLLQRTLSISKTLIYQMQPDGLVTVNPKPEISFLQLISLITMQTTASLRFHWILVPSELSWHVIIMDLFSGSSAPSYIRLGKAQLLNFTLEQIQTWQRPTAESITAPGQERLLQGRERRILPLLINCGIT